MKNVVIVGKNSYVGMSLRLRLGGDYSFTEIDPVSPDFNIDRLDLKKYDVCINVAAIVHRKKEKCELFYKINRDFAFSVAKKAKDDGVSQFIQMSTRGVFGVSNGEIDESTIEKPITAYEKSKYEADVLIKSLESDNFKVCIVRPPMIYGKGCKGNFPRLEKFALHSLFFPSFKNKKDLLYIGNFSQFIKHLIDNDLFGTFYPRDPEPVCVSEMVQKIALVNGKKIRLIGLFNPLIRLLLNKNKTITSIFGSSRCLIEDQNGFRPNYHLDDSVKEMYSNDFLKNK